MVFIIIFPTGEFWLTDTVVVPRRQVGFISHANHDVDCQAVACEAAAC